MIIYQVNTDILGTADGLIFPIKEFRNKNKLFEKGKRGINQKNYEEILKQHIEDFGFETDNLGFYLNDSRQTVGSTFYVGNALRRLKNLKEIEKDGKLQVYYVAHEVGAQLQEIIEGLEIAVPELKGCITTESKHEYFDEFEIEYKDINHTRLFNGNEQENVFKYLLLLILQECFAVTWISENYDSSIIDRDFIDDYFLNRFVAIRIDSIVDSLINLKENFASQFDELANNGKGELATALDVYMLSSFDKVAELRNTIHYDDVKNFYDYFIEDEVIINLTEILNLNRTIFKCIEEFLSISNIPSQY
ncbi:hypothetical protein MKY34_12215 [Sporosarcina sp. FSL K6-1522]|uniref:hypothetical protein n=1 Tax=Sporosarcina sp. FSL K6-1522 TaxID=2921554 RepID=UPI00315A6BDE